MTDAKKEMRRSDCNPSVTPSNIFLLHLKTAHSIYITFIIDVLKKSPKPQDAHGAVNVLLNTLSWSFLFPALYINGVCLFYGAGRPSAH